MAEVVWRQRAVRHLGEIFSYLSQQNPSAAKNYVAELKRACERLGEFPEKAPRYDERYRALVFRNHLVFYRFDREEDEVVIIGVIDGRRDVTAILRKLKDR